VIGCPATYSTAKQNQLTDIGKNGDVKKIKDLVGDGSLKHIDSAKPITSVVIHQ